MADLELQEVCKGFAEPVLDRLSFTVAEGEFFVVVGPSGIGKTTLLRCIAGLEALNGGRVLISGRDVTRVPPYRRNVAMTFESYALYPHLTVFENIASPLRARRTAEAEVKSRVTAVAELLRIAPLMDRKPHEISGGQKQRTALGRTLVARPDIFLLDEPISHLDAKIRHELRRQFHTLEDLRRVATVYVTHDYAEALSLGDRIGIMADGGLQQIGTAKEVFHHPATIFVARHLGQPSINEVPCRLEYRDGALYATAEQAAFAYLLPLADAAILRDQRQDVVVGIRPQHIHLADPGRPAGASETTGHHTVSGRVELFEALGATGVLVADVDGVPLTALTTPEVRFEPGEPVRLTLEISQFHYFCPETGQSLRS
jgi:multiple sugar transport system ATP-binding protein